MELPQIPRPPKSLVLQGWAKSAGVFLLGLTGVITSLTVTANLSETQAGQAETQCRSSLASEAARLEGEINVRGWTALIEFRSGASETEAQKIADELADLAEQWREAQARRGRANEICGKA